MWRVQRLRGESGCCGPKLLFSFILLSRAYTYSKACAQACFSGARSVWCRLPEQCCSFFFFFWSPLKLFPAWEISTRWILVRIRCSCESCSSFSHENELDSCCFLDFRGSFMFYPPGPPLRIYLLSTHRKNFKWLNSCTVNWFLS